MFQRSRNQFAVPPRAHHGRPRPARASRRASRARHCAHHRPRRFTEGPIINRHTNEFGTAGMPMHFAGQRNDSREVGRMPVKRITHGLVPRSLPHVHVLAQWVRAAPRSPRLADEHRPDSQAAKQAKQRNPEGHAGILSGQPPETVNKLFPDSGWPRATPGVCLASRTRETQSTPSRRESPPG